MLFLRKQGSKRWNGSVKTTQMVSGRSENPGILLLKPASVLL